MMTFNLAGLGWAWRGRARQGMARQGVGAWLYLAMLFLFVLAGCSTLVKPVSVRQSIAYTEGALTATYQSIRDAKVEGRITAEKRNELVAQADKVGDALDASRVALGVGDISTAEGKLKLARSALLALEAVLKTYGG